MNENSSSHIGLCAHPPARGTYVASAQRSNETSVSRRTIVAKSRRPSRIRCSGAPHRPRPRAGPPGPPLAGIRAGFVPVGRLGAPALDSRPPPPGTGFVSPFKTTKPPWWVVGGAQGITNRPAAPFLPANSRLLPPAVPCLFAAPCPRIAACGCPRPVRCR